jgi:hypothetical protein
MAICIYLKEVLVIICFSILLNILDLNTCPVNLWLLNVKRNTKYELTLKWFIRLFQNFYTFDELSLINNTNIF